MKNVKKSVWQVKPLIALMVHGIEVLVYQKHIHFVVTTSYGSAN